MKKQNINLLQIEKKRQKFELDFLMILKIVGGLAGLLALITLYSFVRHWMLQSEYLKLEAAKEKETQKLTATASKLPSKQTSDEVKQSIEKLTQTKKERETIIIVLTERKTSQFGNFSTYLLALSKEAVEGIWLTKILLEKSGNQVTLEGKTLKPSLVPKLIDGLGQEPVFAGKTFQVFKLTTDAKTQQISFILQSEAEQKS